MYDEFAYSIDDSAREHLIPNLRIVASQPWVGLTAYVGDEPHLVIGKEGEDTYLMEDEYGQVKRIDFIFPWEEPKIEENKLVAASRIPESPFRTAGFLCYDEETGEWAVRVGTSNMRFPLEDRIAALEDDGWSKYSDAASPAGGLDLGGTHSIENHEGVPHDDHPGGGLREPTIEVRAACPHCGSDQHLEEMGDHTHDRPHHDTERQFACHNCGKWSFEHELKVSDHDKDHQDENPEDVDYEEHDDDADRHQDPEGKKPDFDPDKDEESSHKKKQSATFHAQGFPAAATHIATGIAINLDKENPADAMARIQTLQSPADAARDFVNQKNQEHGTSFPAYDNPFVNRGGGFRQAAPPRLPIPDSGQKYPEHFENANNYILVKKFVAQDDITWILTPQCAGILTSEGGEMSHVQVVAKGAGKVSIVAPDNILDDINPGDLITLDGHTGEISVNGARGAYQRPKSFTDVIADAPVYRFVYANGHGEVEKMVPGSMTGDKGGHMGMMMSLMGQGHWDMGDMTEQGAPRGLAYGFFCTNGTIQQDKGTAHAVDPDQFLGWAHQEEQALGLPPGQIQYRDISQGMGGDSAATAPAVDPNQQQMNIAAVTGEELDSGGAKLDKPPKCPHCGSHTIEMLNRGEDDDAGFLCLNCDNTFKADFRRTAGVKHPKGTRVELNHPNKKGIKGSIADHVGTDENFGDELYDLLLDNGDEMKKVPDVHFKRIKSASIVVVGLQTEAAEYAEQLGRSTDQDPDEIASILSSKGLIESDQDWTDVRQIVNHVRGQNPQALSSMLKGAPYPEKSYHNSPDHSPPGQEWPAEVNAVYNACMREGNGDKEKCARIAWAQYKKTKKDKGHGTTEEEGKAKEGTHKSADMMPGTLPTSSPDTTGNTPTPPCPHCGNPTVGNPSQYYCPSCGWSSSQGMGGQPTPQMGTPGTPAPSMTGTVPSPSYHSHVKSAALSVGEWYTMYSPDYKVPDVIQVVEVNDHGVTANIEGDDKGLFPITLPHSEIEKSGYKFEPYSNPTEVKEAKTARRSFTVHEQNELVNENLEGRARNYSKLNLEGTHYQQETDENPLLAEFFLW